MGLLKFFDDLFLSVERNDEKRQYADKKRMPDWLSQPQSNSAEVRKSIRHVTKMVQDFENPRLPGEKKDNLLTAAKKGIEDDAKRGGVKSTKRWKNRARLNGISDYIRSLKSGCGSLDGTWSDNKLSFKKELIETLNGFLDTGWKKPWEPSLPVDDDGYLSLAPYSIRNRRYQGSNSFFLSLFLLRNGIARDIPPIFLTKKNAESNGGKIIDETVSEIVLSVFPYVSKIKDIDETTNEEGDTDKEIQFACTACRVFHISNVEALDNATDALKNAINKRVTQIDVSDKGLLEYVENIINKLRELNRLPKMIHDQYDSCYYLPSSYEIHMVGHNAFKSIEEYYSTLFHEITHSTNGNARFNHKRSHDYSTKAGRASEELVAEFGALMLCTEFGLHYTKNNSLKYLASWRTRLSATEQDDVILDAFAEAQDAVEFLLEDVDVDELLPSEIKLLRKPEEIADKQVVKKPTVILEASYKKKPKLPGEKKDNLLTAVKKGNLVALGKVEEADLAERSKRLEKLKANEPLVFTGHEHEGKYELNNKSANKYILENLRGEYVNKDTSTAIMVSRKGADKVTRHDAESEIHLKSIAYIPQMIENAIFIGEEVNTKDKNKYDSYRYYVVGLNIGEVDYTAKLVVGVKNGETYYDHALTKIEKNNLVESIDLIKRKFANNEDVISYFKDKRLFSILQTNPKENAKKKPTAVKQGNQTAKAGEPIVEKVNSIDGTDLQVPDRERSRVVQETNDKFNEELQQHIDGTLPKGHVYRLGTPSDILKSAGMPDLPIEMASARLSNKSNQENHPFNLSEVKDLPRAIQNPLAVFRSATHIDSNLILTEITRRNKNFVVAIKTNKEQGKIEVNSIRSIHPRTTTNIVSWINDGLMDYANIKKLQDWISDKIKTKDYLNSSNPADVRKSLVSATKIIQDFENPRLPGEKKDNFPTAVKQGHPKNTKADTKKDRATRAVDRRNLLGFVPITSEETAETFRLGGELGKFIGEFDRCSFSIVLRGDKGAGKSRLLYQLMNLFAYHKLKIGFYSLEMSRNSSVSRRYREEYITPCNLEYIDISDTSPVYDELSNACKKYDVVAVDSWTKLKNVEQADFDRLQKENPGTILLCVFQSTTGKVTRGGNMPEYDGGIVIHVHKGGIAECEKNRYNSTELEYDVFNRKLIKEKK